MYYLTLLAFEFYIFALSIIAMCCDVTQACHVIVNTEQSEKKNSQSAELVGILFPSLFLSYVMFHHCWERGCIAFSKFVIIDLFKLS